MLSERQNEGELVTKNEKVANWLNYAEINFLKVLDRAVDRDAYIFTKVKVNDILMKVDTADELDEYDYGEKAFDFVLCDKQDLSIMCIIELDSRPHALQALQAEESFDTLCDELNIPLLEIPARCGYNIFELKRYLSLCIAN